MIACLFPRIVSKGDTATRVREGGREQGCPRKATSPEIGPESVPVGRGDLFPRGPVVLPAT